MSSREEALQTLTRAVQGLVSTVISSADTPDLQVLREAADSLVKSLSLPSHSLPDSKDAKSTAKNTKKRVLDQSNLNQIHLNLDPNDGGNGGGFLNETVEPYTRELLKDEADVTPDGKFQCRMCSREFTRFANLNSHIKIHLNLKPFKCSHCNLTFARRHDVQRHENTHSKKKQFTCKLCNKSFARKDILKRHETMNPNVKRLYCVSHDSGTPQDVVSDIPLPLISSQNLIDAYSMQNVPNSFNFENVDFSANMEDSSVVTMALFEQLQK